MRLIPHRRLARVGVVTACLAVSGGVAYAAESSPFVGPRGNINSCLPPNGGALHVWKPGHGCSGGWAALAFPTSGTTGPTGTTGNTGATGAANPAAISLDGQTLTKVMTREPTPSTVPNPVTLYDNDGLTITGNCSSSGVASLAASGPASADSELTVSGFDSVDGGYGSQTNSLGAASNIALGPAGSGEATFSYSNTAGQLVNGQLGYQSADSYATYLGCAFFGDITTG